MNALQIISLVITTIATVVLACLTSRYVRLTHLMLEETKSQKEPNVWVDLELPPRNKIILLIGNSGSAPAKDLKFEVVDNITWRKEYRVSLKIAVFTNKFSCLATAKTIS